MQVLCNLVKNGKLDTTPYDNLVNLVKDQYNFKTLVIVGKFHFSTRP